MDMATVMQREQALAFVTDLLDNCVPKGQVNRVGEFYAEDVIGHYRGEQFTFADLKKRIGLLGENVIAHKLDIIDFMQFADYLFVVSRQSWQMRADKQWHEVHMSVVYRLQHNKIAELWAVWDSDTGSFTTVNENFPAAFANLVRDEKSKAAFKRHLEKSFVEFSADKPPLTERQIDYLYYYVNGLSAKEIAQIVHRSFRTIEDHLQLIKHYFAVGTKAELRKKVLG